MRVRGHRPGHADRRADQAAGRRARRASALLRRPTPTASPTSTSDALLRFHAGHGALATMTVVRPELQFGVTELDAPTAA